MAHRHPDATGGADGLRLLADEMLGRLARWLRLLGYDVAYGAGRDDADLVRQALAEGRMLLTRDRRLAADPRLTAGFVVRAEAPLEQLREIVTRLDLDWRAGLFSRCTICNAPLAQIGRQEAGGRVPPRVREERRGLRHCPSCRRIYWQGSHAARMRRDLERLLGG